ncbi:uncharacterized protein DUF1176 [Tahibacter aquaticus]|uniref:Uncharacterized protein DUF1176 n=1 Tax=Tahibacter aquaticus TaxID=520092 RepID=A0A4V6PYG8_9GAMM|nr:DUF1176 domain-containing protein [Tahibacter aquaticus]TDR47386.1 uncharacterized protein DUF1176 [Tahibacter aquaticus]
MPFLPTRLAIPLLALLPVTTVAAPPASLSFTHNDWEIACDNTRTCRAAGYQRDGDEPPVSVLLTREAGPGKPVKGQVMLGSYDDQAAAPKTDLLLRIGEQDLGKVALAKGELQGDLSSAQVDALLAALRRDSAIAFVAGGLRWKLSDQGASTVLLKMDEFQGRLGTPGALVRKGDGDESKVLPALPVPVVVVPKQPATTAADLALAGDAALRRAVLATVKEDDCAPPKADGEGDDDDEEGTLGVQRLSAGKLLVSLQCWMAAYNEGSGYWVVDDKPPYAATLVTTMASDYTNGQISSAQKGRGLGDCWSTNSWSWNGQAFLHTAAATTGQCKLVAAGGAWELPTLVTTVKQP